MKIKNVPACAIGAEFIVVRKVNGEFWFYGAYGRDSAKAEKVASEINGIVCHNMRV